MLLNINNWGPVFLVMVLSIPTWDKWRSGVLFRELFRLFYLLLNVLLWVFRGCFQDSIHNGSLTSLTLVMYFLTTIERLWSVLVLPMSEVVLKFRDWIKSQSLNLDTGDKTYHPLETTLHALCMSKALSLIDSVWLWNKAETWT